MIKIYIISFVVRSIQFFITDETQICQSESTFVHVLQIILFVLFNYRIIIVMRSSLLLPHILDVLMRFMRKLYKRLFKVHHL